MPAALYALRAFAVLAGIALGILALQVALVKAAEPESRPSSAARSPSARVIEGRAIETVIWGMPAVNFDLLGQAIMQAKGTNNQMDYPSRLLDWKNQMLTPTPLRRNQYHEHAESAPANLDWSRQQGTPGDAAKPGNDRSSRSPVYWSRYPSFRQYSTRHRGFQVFSGPAKALTDFKV